jgi:hypothetical protein
MSLWGFLFKRKEEEIEAPSFAPKEIDDGAIIVAPSGGYGVSLDLDGTVRSDQELISKYREMSLHSEIDMAIDEITNHAICIDEDKVVELDLEKTSLSDSIKKKFKAEFDEVVKLTNFNKTGYNIFRRWYIDGRLYYHVIIDEKDPKKGITELRYIDPRKIRKIKEVDKKKTPSKDYGEQGTITKVKNEYFVYNDKGFIMKDYNNVPAVGLKIARDSIVYCTSGLTDVNGTTILSYLHSAIKPLNQLKTLEDATVIYKLVRSPERRVWYIDVGNLPKMKAEQYVRDIMTKHKNRLTYDAGTGKVNDERKMMLMLDDYWLPRREGGRGTQVDTLPSTANWEMDDVNYFQKNLLNSLHVPVSRLDTDSGFDIGSPSTITREELRFGKFIIRLRNQFSHFFLKILEKQLVLKGIVSIEEWEEIKDQINFSFATDTYFTELKRIEVLQNRLNILQTLNGTDAVGVYYSREWVMKNVLKLTPDEIDEIQEQIREEESDPDSVAIHQASLDQMITPPDEGGSDNAPSKKDQAPVKQSLSKEKARYQQLMSKQNKTDAEYAEMQHDAQRIAKSGTTSDQKVLKYGKYGNKE